MNLEIIIVSTRPGRIGGTIGAWITQYARDHSEFTIHVSDLAELDLPLFNEPGHPRLGEYVHSHTKEWSAQITQADAFLIVTPEYNFTIPPSLANAIDYLHKEWQYKPVAFVGYGGTGAVRAIQAEKLLLANLNAMPIMQNVNLMGVYSGMEGGFAPNERYEQAAKVMLSELHKWAVALKPLHNLNSIVK